MPILYEEAESVDVVAYTSLSSLGIVIFKIEAFAWTIGNIIQEYGKHCDFNCCPSI